MLSPEGRLDGLGNLILDAVLNSAAEEVASGWELDYLSQERIVDDLCRRLGITGRQDPFRRLLVRRSVREVSEVLRVMAWHARQGRFTSLS